MCGGGLIGESLAGFFPAAGCAPHVPFLHAVHLPTLLCLSPGFPGSRGRFGCDGCRGMALANSGVDVGGWLPLFSDAHCPDLGQRTLVGVVSADVAESGGS